MYEYKLYSKISPQECLASAKGRTEDTRNNLITFSSTHDKLANWVTYTVLVNEALGKRADTVDFWIKVADVRLPAHMLTNRQLTRSPAEIPLVE